MSRILRISDAASLAMHTAVFLAARSDAPQPVSAIARVIGASEAHLSKVLQQLARAGIARSVRGPKGGYVLGAASENLTLLDVYQAIEGSAPFADCLMGSPFGDPRHCIMGGLIGEINRRVHDYLAGARLSDLTKAYQGITP